MDVTERRSLKRIGHTDGSDEENPWDAHDTDDDVRSVELHKTVDVEGASKEDVEYYRELAGIFSEMFKTAVEKDQGYNRSFESIGKHLADRSGFPDDPLMCALQAQMVQTGHKRERLDGLLFGDSTDTVGEAAEETAMDAANYWVLKTWLMRHSDLGDETDTPDGVLMDEGAYATSDPSDTFFGQLMEMAGGAHPETTGVLAGQSPTVAETPDEDPRDASQNIKEGDPVETPDGDIGVVDRCSDHSVLVSTCCEETECFSPSQVTPA